MTTKLFAAVAAVLAVLGLTTGCGSTSASTSSKATPTAASTIDFSTETTCADWTTASADARARLGLALLAAAWKSDGSTESPDGAKARLFTRLITEQCRLDPNEGLGTTEANIYLKHASLKP